MGFKYVIGAIAICLSFSATVAHALPSYEYNADGEIVGISSVDVQGALWDMTLHDGSFDALYGSIGLASLYSVDFAYDASVALFDFTSTDSHPADLFLGCALPEGCLIFTAYEYDPDAFLPGVYGWEDVYIPGNDQDLVYDDWHPSAGDIPSTAHATWALSSTVPEPSIAILMASGLIAFGVVRRKSRA